MCEWYMAKGSSLHVETIRAVGAVAIGEPFVQKGQCPLSSGHRWQVGVSDQVFQVLRISKGHWRLRYLCKSLFFAFFWGGVHCVAWASQRVLVVKNPPPMQDTWVWSLGWEDPLEEGMPTHSSGLENPTDRDRGAWRATVHGVAKNRTWLNWLSMHARMVCDRQEVSSPTRDQTCVSCNGSPES